MDIRGKKISIIGAVRSGIGAAKLAKKLGAIPFVSDSGSKEKLKNSTSFLVSEGIAFECGAHSETVFDCDLMITSPGVPTNSEILQNALAKNIRVVSEVEFASWFCKGEIISITGASGKAAAAARVSLPVGQGGIKC